MSYTPGPGDAEAWPMTIRPRDPRYVEQDPEVAAALRNEAESFLAENIANERMKSLAWVNDAQSDFTTAESDQITAAIINADLADKAGNAEAITALIKIGRLVLEATRSSIKRDADKAARECAARLEKEDDADYYEGGRP